MKVPLPGGSPLAMGALDWHCLSLEMTGLALRQARLADEALL